MIAGGSLDLSDMKFDLRAASLAKVGFHAVQVMQACRDEYRSKKAHFKWEMELDNQWRSKNDKPLRFASVQLDPQDEEDMLPNGERAGEHDGPQLSEEWVPPPVPGKGPRVNAKNARSHGELPRLQPLVHQASRHDGHAC